MNLPSSRGLTRAYCLHEPSGMLHHVLPLLLLAPPVAIPPALTISEPIAGNDSALFKKADGQPKPEHLT